MKQKVTKKEIQEILLHYADRYNQLSFIEQDPISIPHQFHRKQDIEIIGFWVAMLSWGNRKTIINKGNELITLFEQNPYDFIRFHSELDLRRFDDLSIEHLIQQMLCILFLFFPIGILNMIA